ncbi:DUF1361 domain-containing protein [Clostridium sp. Marseille-Q7071]
MEILKNFKTKNREKLNIYAFRVLFWGYILVSLLFIDRFNFMILNLSLVYIPFELSVIISNMKYKEKKSNRLLYWVVFLLWLFFYPNAPYLITDFFHLARLDYIDPMRDYIFTSDPYVWKYFCYLSTGIIFGIGMGLLSLKLVYKSIRDITKKISSNMFIVVVAILSSYAIYIGRFLRLHTLDLIIYPFDTIKQMTSVFSSEFFYFMLYITIVQLIIYAIWKLIRD